MFYPPKIDPAKETTKITAFIKRTFKEAGKSEALIAASGGVDSSTSLILASQALGPKNLHVLYLPARATDPIHLEHLQQVVKLAKVPETNLKIIPVTAIIQKTWRIINHYTTQEVRPQGTKRSDLYGQFRNRSEGRPIFAGSSSQAQPSKEARTTNSRRLQGPGHQHGKPLNKQEDSNTNPLQPSEFRLPELAALNRLRLANLAARARMLVIYDQAKFHDALVIGTENHSEHLLGYFTRFGDEASDVEPLKHLYKTQLLELAGYLKVPTEIIEKPPTAGLWFGQTDEAELGFSYEEADPILYLRFEQKMSPNKIAKLVADQTQKKTEDIVPLVKKILDRTEMMGFKHNLPHVL